MSMTRQGLLPLSKEELVKLCKQFNVSSTGSQADIVERILNEIEGKQINISVPSCCNMALIKHKPDRHYKFKTIESKANEIEISSNSDNHHYYY